MISSKANDCKIKQTSVVQVIKLQNVTLSKGVPFTAVAR